MDNLVRDATPGDAFVFCCELLRHFALSLVDLISVDAGHGGRNDVGGKYACACKSRCQPLLSVLIY